jgi:hypothetical protein
MVGRCLVRSADHGRAVSKSFGILDVSLGTWLRKERGMITRQELTRRRRMERTINVRTFPSGDDVRNGSCAFLS